MVMVGNLYIWHTLTTSPNNIEKTGKFEEGILLRVKRVEALGAYFFSLLSNVRLEGQIVNRLARKSIVKHDPTLCDMNNFC